MQPVSMFSGLTDEMIPWNSFAPRPTSKLQELSGFKGCRQPCGAIMSISVPGNCGWMVAAQLKHPGPPWQVSASAPPATKPRLMISTNVMQIALRENELGMVGL
jgi:hypothetical protein